MMIGSGTTCRTGTGHGGSGDEMEGMPTKVRLKVEELAAKWRAKVAANPELAKLSLEPVQAPGKDAPSERFDEIEPVDRRYPHHPNDTCTTDESVGCGEFAVWKGRCQLRSART